MIIIYCSIHVIIICCKLSWFMFGTYGKYDSTDLHCFNTIELILLIFWNIHVCISSAFKEHRFVIKHLCMCFSKYFLLCVLLKDASVVIFEKNLNIYNQWRWSHPLDKSTYPFVLNFRIGNSRLLQNIMYSSKNISYVFKYLKCPTFLFVNLNIDFYILSNCDWFFTLLMHIVAINLDTFCFSIHLFHGTGSKYAVKQILSSMIYNSKHENCT